MRKLVLLLLCFTIVLTATSQDYWSTHADAGRITTDKAVARLSFPKDFKLFDLNITPLRNVLFSVVGNVARHSTVITLPNADGGLEQFEVVESSNFEPALQAQFPDIRAFSGKGITDKYATLKLSISPQGIQTMVFRTGKPNEFIEAYSADRTVYAVFHSQRSAGTLGWTCSTPERQLATGIDNQVNALNITGRSGGDLKTMRLAQSCNGEYSNFFGATSSAQVSLVLAAFNATLTRCNGIYEKDLALHLNLIANTTAVIYYNPATDPYSTNLSQWNSQLQSTLTSVIGEANYDIGHMFGASGGGGNAGCIGCVCVNGSKGSGITSPADAIPQGDNFDIDYVAHEVGHQLGANHTFSMSNEGTGVNKEPGSGITIMGYAGITSQDLAPHSIDIFHQASIAQIQANLATKTCPVTTSITATNATPVVNAGADYTIPISTPFALTGSATDANAGDVLTYCWEQNDNAGSTQTGASSVASATKATGPNWISFSPVTSPTRLFPKLSTILAGQNVSGPLTGGDAGANTEALSSVSRTLNFRLTVRDNAPYSSTAPVSVGQTQFDDVVVTVTNTSGPFAVTAPNTAVSWAGNSAQTITWSVANTTAAPVSCANVKISISTDGGNNFTTLVSSTPNDGSEVVTIPNTPSTTARVKIEAVGNIFFDISNTNFTITSGSACGAPSGLASSGVTTTAATVSWTAVSGANSYDVDYKLNSSATWINAATGTTSTSIALSGLTSGSLYDWRVRANCTSGSSAYTQAQFTTQSTATCNAPTGLTASAITSSGATVSWTAASGALSYDVDYKTNASATWINAATGTTGTSVNLSGLSASTLYDWRVRTNCSSGSSAYAQAQFTTATVSTCPGPYDVSTNGTRNGAALIPFNTDIKGLINPSGDNDYYRFVISTAGTITVTLSTLPADYDLRLYRNNTQVAISQNGGTTSETINYTATAGTYYARVYGFNNVSNATNCYTLRVALGTATRGEELITGTEMKVNVFPNPAKNVLNVNIAGNTDKKNITVFDVNGKLVISSSANQPTTSLDITQLSSGIYFLKVNSLDGKALYQQKFIKD
ncbi:MAG: fibronectin type III domain-containing protein [Chitinophagaceae bacterium]|nr:fibronectin type III domain-containing protein [Chitinophagaceae bacterium]